MLGGGYSWRLFFYVEFAFAAALFIFAFFVVEESYYIRQKPRDQSDPPSESEKQRVESAEEGTAAYIPQRKSFAQTLKFWGVFNRDSEFFTMMVRSFTYFLVPHVFWVITTYGKSCFFGFPSATRANLIQADLPAPRN